MISYDTYCCYFRFFETLPIFPHCIEIVKYRNQEEESNLLFSKKKPRNGCDIFEKESKTKTNLYNHSFVCLLDIKVQALPY